MDLQLQLLYIHTTRSGVHDDIWNRCVTNGSFFGVEGMYGCSDNANGYQAYRLAVRPFILQVTVR